MRCAEGDNGAGVVAALHPSPFHPFRPLRPSVWVLLRIRAQPWQRRPKPQACCTAAPSGVRPCQVGACDEYQSFPARSQNWGGGWCGESAARSLATPWRCGVERRKAGWRRRMVEGRTKKNRHHGRMVTRSALPLLNLKPWTLIPYLNPDPETLNPRRRQR